MAKLNALTEKAIPTLKPGKHVDGRGLTLIVRPTGRRYFTLRHQGAEGETTKTLGDHTSSGGTLSLALARQEAERVRVHRREDPEPAKKRVPTLDVVIEDWNRVRAANFRADYVTNSHRRLTRNLNVDWFSRAIDSFEPPEILDTIEKIGLRGKKETARRVRQLLSQVFDHAIVMGHLKYNPAPLALTKVLGKKVVTNRPAVPWKQMPDCWKKLDTCTSFLMVLLVRFIILTAAKAEEATEATWDEIDLDAARWTIPPERTKMHHNFVIPLSKQAVELLRLVPRLSNKYVFVSPYGVEQPYTTAAVLATVKSLGIKDERGRLATTHGFRSSFRTAAGECGWQKDISEAALNHKQPGMDGIYDRGTRFEQRKVLMQRWADYCCAGKDFSYE